MARYPRGVKGITGWGLALFGDGAAQAIESREKLAMDWRRSLAFSVHNGLWTAFGLHPILNAVERLAPGVGARAVATKTVPALWDWTLSEKREQGILYGPRSAGLTLAEFHGVASGSAVVDLRGVHFYTYMYVGCRRDVLTLVGRVDCIFTHVYSQ